MPQWDCVVVGGGAAGLSAALVLGRARRRTLILDAGEQSNRIAASIGGLLGHDGRSPAQFYEAGRREVTSYPSVEHRTQMVVGGEVTDCGVALDLLGGERVTARRVLIATGMRYCPPDIPGLQALWGHSVFQCPFCDGWEMRDKRLAALAAGADALHDALILRGWSDDVVLLTDSTSALSLDDRRRMERAGVWIEDRRVTELIGEGTQLTHIALADGARLQRDGLLVEAPMRQRSSLAEQLGATYTQGPIAADAIAVDSLHTTANPAIFAAGDVCTKHPTVADAVDAGSQAAVVIVQSLLADDFGLPAPSGRH